MKLEPPITLMELSLDELDASLLQKFNRYQETNRVWYKDGDYYKQKDDHFIEQWDDEKKRLVLQSLVNCVSSGGIVIGAFANGDLIGFANVEAELFGSHKEYLELPFIHVSSEFRGSGVGRKLFARCCQAAKRLGAVKLYIASHPSVESQRFYQAVGCTYAEEINPKIYAKEPLDIQLEFAL